MLKPGGVLAFYDAVATDEKPDLFFPTPWPTTAAESTLPAAGETRDMLAAAGFDRPDGTAPRETDMAGWLTKRRSSLQVVAAASEYSPLEELFDRVGRLEGDTDQAAGTRRDP